MGPDSELGPIDPYWGGIPADYIVKAQEILIQRDPILVQSAMSAIKQTKELAIYLLKTGMLKDLKTDAELDTMVSKLATRDEYHSHGAVIDAEEAKTLGLNVEIIHHDDPFWKQLWLLRAMYSYDCQKNGYSKLFETQSISSPVSVPLVPSTP